MTLDGGAERERAWAALSANVFVLPGLGSILLGRRSGWVQAVLALAGFALSVAWLAGFAVQWWRQGQWPELDVSRLAEPLRGIALFGLGWCWALVTGLSAVWRAGRTRPRD